MKIPQNIQYTKDHEWIKIEGNIATVGITEFAQSELGDIVFVEVETLSQVVNQNEVFGTIEAVKTVSDLFMPLTGKVIEVNNMITTKPELINKDPYNHGWIIKIEISNQSEVVSLLSHSEYKNSLGIE